MKARDYTVHLAVGIAQLGRASIMVAASDSREDAETIVEAMREVLENRARVNVLFKGRRIEM
jgi:hypothetical protein